MRTVGAATVIGLSAVAVVAAGPALSAVPLPWIGAAAAVVGAALTWDLRRQLRIVTRAHERGSLERWERLTDYARSRDASTARPVAATCAFAQGQPAHDPAAVPALSRRLDEVSLHLRHTAEQLERTTAASAALGLAVVRIAGMLDLDQVSTPGSAPPPPSRPTVQPPPSGVPQPRPTGEPT